MEQQPTSFTLTTHTLQEVFNTPQLITSLATYSESLQTSLSEAHLHRGVSNLHSVLFLQVFAAADYFTINKTLMQNVPPVNVDISESDLMLSKTVVS